MKIKGYIVEIEFTGMLSNSCYNLAINQRLFYMFKINREKNNISKMSQKTFSELGFRERDHLQEWIINQPNEVFGEELLILQKEFAGFAETKERLDILAIDKQGCLIIIENKLDDSGKDVAWQAIKYTSYCSSLTKENIKQIFQDYLDKNHISENAEQKLVEFLNETSFEDLEINIGSSQRIFFVAANFKKEVTSAILWLINYEIEIQCFKVTPYSDGDELFLSFDQIIPTKDSEDYRIFMADKIKEEKLIKKENLKSNPILIDFWDYLLIKFNDTESDLYKNVRARPRRYLGSRKKFKKSGIGFNFAVTKSNARVEVYIDTGIKEKNIEIFNHFYSNKNSIEQKFGNTLTWNNVLERKNALETRYCSIRYETNGNYQSENNWDQMTDFLSQSMIKLEKSITPFISSV